jgi:hypothetical protein
MQLVMRRARNEKAFWYNFKINARMVVDQEETDLLYKYKLHDVVLTRGNMGRDLKTATLIAGVLTLILYLVLRLPPIAALLFFAVACYLSYHQIREEVRVNDLLTGRDFNARSFLDLLQKEYMIRKTSDIFANVVAQARTWDEPEVIDLEPQPLFTVLEGNHRAAA